MTEFHRHLSASSFALTICQLGLKNQRLISRYLDWGLDSHVTELKQIDERFTELFAQVKQSAYPSEEEQRAMGITHYVWRTRGDSKVRSSHAANNGKIFAWDDPPPTGHPGTDYGCRCLAEPYVNGKTEYAEQTLAVAIDDNPIEWTNIDFTRHFYLGESRGVTLSETGHLQGVIDYYFYHLQKEGKRVYDRINSQIIDEARKHANGEFSYYFYDSYEFKPYLFVFGKGTVSGLFTGSIKTENGIMNIQGDVEYFYDDIFTDPLDIRELYEQGARPEDLNWIERITEIGGSYFPIKDNWRTQFRGEALLNGETSIYR